MASPAPNFSSSGLYPQATDSWVDLPVPYPGGRDNPPLKRQGIEVPNTRRPGQTGHWRNGAFPELITVDSHPSFPKTDHELFERGLKRSGNKPCLGHRPWDPVARDFAPRYEWQTWNKVAARRSDVGAGLMLLGKEFGWQKNTPVGLWSVNRPEWQITAQACNAYSFVTVPLYDTLGSGVVEWCIDHAEVRVVFASTNHIPALLDIKPRQSRLDVIVSFDDLDGLDGSVGAKHVGSLSKSDVLRKWGAERGVRVMDLKEIEALGSANPAPHRVPTPEDPACICYTSGTTGNPKGAVYTHRIMATAIVAQQHGPKLDPSTDDEVYISYMPLAHCYGRWIEDAALCLGFAIGYSCGDVLRLVEDIQILQPTWMVGVPRVWNRVYQLVKSQTIDAPGIKGALCRRAFDVKLKNLKEKGTTTHWLYDRLVMKKVKKALGGRLKLLGSGAAPIAPAVLDFLEVAFCLEISEGYGQTENNGSALKCYPEDHHSAGTCGPPVPCNELKLIDVPDMNYFSTDKPNPRGELCTRGDNVIKEYYKDPKKTKETVDDEGWLHSGDIAEIDEFGRFRIIDRIKNLMKLAQGEYVALEKVENVYSVSSIGAQIFLYGDSLHNHLILFEPENSAKLASRVLGKTISPTDLAGLAAALADPAVETAALKEYEALAETARLNGYERAKQLRFLKEPFSIENDTMTPTMKVKRSQASKMLKETAEKMYASADADKKPDLWNTRAKL